MTDEHDAVGRLLAVLDLTDLGDDRFAGENVPKPGGRIFGGQVFGQALVAAARTVAEDRFSHSAHGYFIRPGRIDEPLTFAVERLHDGRSFSTRRTHALQEGVPILSMICSFQRRQSGLSHASPMPEVPPPDTLASSMDELGALSNATARFWSVDSPFDTRHVDGSLFLGPAATTTPQQMVWMRTRRAVPSDWTTNAALLAYACDQPILESVMRAHGASWATPGISVASLDHAMWWHRPFRADEWFLLVQNSPSAEGGRGLGSMAVYDEQGTLIASIMQEGMIRVPTL